MGSRFFDGFVFGLELGAGGATAVDGDAGHALRFAGIFRIAGWIDLQLTGALRRR